MARKFLAELLTHKEVRALLSDEHFSVDGTQVQAWASMKSFVAKDGSGDPPSPGRNGERDFHGEKRSNDTHASTTEPEAKLYKKGKGKEAKLSYIGNVMTRTATARRRRPGVGHGRARSGDGDDRASFAGRAAHHRRGDKAFDTADFVADMRAFNVTPHIAQNATGRRSAIDGRTTHHSGYEISQQKRKRVEEPFGWDKTIGGLARPIVSIANVIRFGERRRIG